MNILHLITNFLNISWMFSPGHYPPRFKALDSGAANWTPSPRVYGGLEAEKGQFPFMVFILMGTQEKLLAECSGSLIKPKTVLTAAHCVSFLNDPVNNVITVGGIIDATEYKKERKKMKFNADIEESTCGCEERRPEKVIIYPEYSVFSKYGDVALIHLKAAFKSTDIKVVPLSQNQLEKTKKCTIVGFGLSMDEAKTKKLHFQNNIDVHTTLGSCYFLFLKPFLCIHSEKTRICPGDSGSPLICEEKVWGVASHAILKDNFKCNESYEQYYTDLYVFLDWVERGGSRIVVANSKILIIVALPLFWYYLALELRFCEFLRPSNTIKKVYIKVINM